MEQHERAAHRAPESRAARASVGLMFIPRCLFIAVVVVALTRSSSARADAYEAALASAVGARDTAMKSRDPLDWERAADGFFRAIRFRRTSEAYFELGSVAEHLRQDDLAVEAYQAALDLGLVGPPRVRASEFLQKHAGEMGRLEIIGPASANVYIEKRWRGSLPLYRPVVVFGGDVALEFVVGGSRVARQVHVAAGSLKVLHFDRQTTAPFTKGPKSKLSVRPSQPQTPNGSRATSKQVSSSPLPTSTPVAPEVLLWGGLTVGVASGALLVGSLLQVETARSELADVCPARDGDACPSVPPAKAGAAQDAVDKIQTFKNLTVVGGIGAGVGVAALLIGWWWRSTNSSARSSGSTLTDTGLLFSAQPGSVSAAFRAAF